MNYKVSYRLYQALLVAALALAVAGWGVHIRWMLYGAILVFALAILEVRLFYKCPHCKKPMDFRMKLSTHCSECGRPLDR